MFHNTVDDPGPFYLTSPLLMGLCPPPCGQRDAACWPQLQAYVSLMAKEKAEGEEPSTYAALSRKQGFENMPINYPTLSLQNVEPRPPPLDVGQT